MATQIIGKIEVVTVTDYYGNERLYIDVYDEPTNQVLHDLTSGFHGKKVMITIQEIKDEI
jgi:hypothetical protein